MNFFVAIHGTSAKYLSVWLLFEGWLLFEVTGIGHLNYFITIGFIMSKPHPKVLSVTLEYSVMSLQVLRAEAD